MCVRRLVGFAVVCGALVVGGCTDLIPFSGGALKGTPAPAPADWSGVAEVDVVELETRSPDPYSVKLWVVALGPALYVHAGTTRSTWVEHMQVDPEVRLLANGLIYELVASRVEDQAEFDRFSVPYEAKYGNRPRNENVNEAFLFRLLPRR